MDTVPALHPADETLHAYGLGKLDDSSAEEVNRHLEACPDCRRRVAEMVDSSITIELAASRGTDAFLALRVGHQGGRWVGATSRIFDDNGRISVGQRGVRFNNNETSGESKAFTPGEYFTIKFSVDSVRNTRIVVNGKLTQNHGHVGIPNSGAIGIFTKSGNVKIRSIIVDSL